MIRVYSNKISNPETTQESSPKSSQEIINLIKENKNITINELSKKIGISTRAIKKHIQKLQESGKLKRIGPNKGGYYKVR